MSSLGKFHVLPALATPRVPKGHLKDKLDRTHRAPKHHQKQTISALREGGQPKPYGVFLAQLLGVQRESVVGSPVRDVGFRRFRRFRSIEAFGI